MRTASPFGAMKRVLLAVLALPLAASAGAQDPDDRGLPLWELGVFGGAGSTPAYPGADKKSSRALALPFLIYRGKVLRSDQSGIGARLLRTDTAEFDVGFAVSLPARSEDVPARAGMPDLGSLVEFGPRVKFKLANPTPASRLRLDLPLRTVIEVKGGLRRRGWTFEPKLVYEMRGAQDRWNLDANVGVVVGDAAINRYFYEVAPQYATPERPVYHARSGLMLMRTGVSGSYKVHPDVRVFAFVRYDLYAGAANRDSPLFRQNTGTSAGIGLAWTFSRSAQRAR
jgi:outer membrane protein